MASEKGHDVNVANLERLIHVCIALAGAYNPSRANLQLAQLDALLVAARAALEGVRTMGTVYLNAVNGREGVYDGLAQLCTRLVNALDATEATDLLIADARTINRKLQGGRKYSETVVPAEGGPELPTQNQISVSQQSFVKRLENFKGLRELLVSEPSYTPNEVELQGVTLLGRIGAMETANSQVSIAAADLANARIARNHLLYDRQTGMVAIANEVKKYIKSVFGASSPEYRQASAIKFVYIR